MTLRKIVSFGYRYSNTPEDSAPGVVVIDVRTLFRNPHRNPALRYKLGTDPDVQKEIEKTPEFRAKYHYVKAQVEAPGVEVAYIGCHGGRHRSVMLAERISKELRVPVEHRDIRRDGDDV